MKICSKCKKSLVLKNFAKNKAMKDGLQHYCRSCNAIATKTYRDKNRDKVLQMYQDYHDTHKEQEKEQYQKWYKKNRQKKVEYCRDYYQKNIDYMRNKQKQWVKDNYQAKLIQVSNRRARLKNAPGKFTKEDFDVKYQEQNGKCCYCHCKKQLTIDHKVPLSRGGSNWPDNIVLACLSCNCSKNDKTFEEFLSLTKEFDRGSSS